MSAAVVHASAVAFGPEGGILIEGPSGSGKSRLALELIDLGADLIADDRTVLMMQEGSVFARCPQSIRGLIEIRGLGLLHLPVRRLARLRLVVDLSDPAGGPRLPVPQTCIRQGGVLAWLAVRPDPALARGLAQGLARTLAPALRRPGSNLLNPIMQIPA